MTQRSARRREFLAAMSVASGALAGCAGRGPFADEPGRAAPYDVTKHGVAGDGETEVGETLQTLLDALDDESGGILYFPPGRYLFERTPLVGSNTTLLGAGRSTVFEGVRPEGERGRALLSNKGYDAAGYGGASNWTVRNVRIDSPDSNGIMPAHASDVRLENVHGDAVRHHHVDVVSSRNVVVDGFRAIRGGEAGSNAPVQFDAQRSGVTKNGVWDGTEATLAADDDTPTSRCTLRNFEIAAQNAPTHGVHLHRGRHESITIADGTVSGCRYTAVRADPEGIVEGLTVDGVSCLGNARGITLGHVERGRRDLTIDDVTVRTADAGAAAGSGLYAAGFDGAVVSNVTVDGAFTNAFVFDDMGALQMSNVTATGAVDQSFRFRENVDATLATARAADCGGAAVYSGPGSAVVYGGLTFDDVGGEVAGDGDVAAWNASSGESS